MFGHLAVNCNEGQSSNKYIVTLPTTDVNNIISADNKMYKVVKVNGISMSALLDTGRQVTFIRENVYKQIGSPMLRMTRISLRGFWRNEVNTLGCFRTVVQIDDEEFELELHVVPNHSISVVAILGNNILKQAELTIKQDDVIISKISHDIFLTQIEVMSDSKVDFTHIIDKFTQLKIMELITSYKPVKTKVVNITMTILVKEERPIYSRPRRLTLPEREIVEKQVEE